MSYADDTGNYMIHDQHNFSITGTIAAALFGALMPPEFLTLAGRIGVAFCCGFASLAGQALWRAAVRKVVSTRTPRSQR